MSSSKYRDTSDLCAITSRLEGYALAVVAHLHLKAANCDDLLSMLAQIIRMIAQSDGLIRKREHFNQNIRLVARVLRDAVFREHVRSVIGAGNIRRWWQKYRGTYEPIRRKVRSKISFQQSQFTWKAYALRPVPNYKEPVQQRLSEYEPSGDRFEREANSFPAFLFYAWELDGYDKPQHPAHSPDKGNPVSPSAPLDTRLRGYERKGGAASNRNHEVPDRALSFRDNSAGNRKSDPNNRGSPNIRQL